MTVTSLKLMKIFMFNNDKKKYCTPLLRKDCTLLVYNKGKITVLLMTSHVKLLKGFHNNIYCYYYYQ